jgi:hypothetical protein
MVLSKMINDDARFHLVVVVLQVASAIRVSSVGSVERSTTSGDASPHAPEAFYDLPGALTDRPEPWLCTSRSRT